MTPRFKQTMHERYCIDLKEIVRESFVVTDITARGGCSPENDRFQSIIVMAGLVF